MSIVLENVSKEFIQNDGKRIFALKDASVKITSRNFVSVIGKSGSGKSSFLKLIAGLIRPTSGSVILDGRDVTSYSKNEWSTVLNGTIGLVPQVNAALPNFNVLENVCLPLGVRNSNPMDAEIRGLDLLESLDIARLAKEYPDKLSGGELRRVAIARALVTNPKYILADEPTNDLDDESVDLVMNLFNRFVQDGGTVVMVTHNGNLLKHADRVLEISKGILKADT